jgi:hypothetical protein
MQSIGYGEAKAGEGLACLAASSVRAPSPVSNPLRGFDPPSPANRRFAAAVGEGKEKARGR